MDHAGNVDEYAIDDKGLVKMRKYYGHKKDRTTRAPKENKLTTNSTIDNTTRLLLLNVLFVSLCHCSSSTTATSTSSEARSRRARREPCFPPSEARERRRSGSA